VDTRKAFRWLAAIAALVFTVHQALMAKQDYQEWQGSTRIGDRSAADFYRLNLKIDCVEVVVAWGFAAGLMYVLRPKLASKP
jgi:hypothetical protein